MNHPELYNFKVNTVYTFEKTETVEVKGPVKSWADFAQEQGITYKTLKRFNPWLRKTDLKNPRHKTYTISIPKKKRTVQIIKITLDEARYLFIHFCYYFS